MTFYTCMCTVQLHDTVHVAPMQEATWYLKESFQAIKNLSFAVVPNWMQQTLVIQM